MIQTFVFKIKSPYIFFLPGALLMASYGCSRYDGNKPDTEANRKGFERWFGMVPDKSITGIYFFADEWGSDAAYWFAFSAPHEEIDKIVLKLKLEPITDQHDNFDPPVKNMFKWWDAEERNKSQYYEFRDDTEEILYSLWYNPETLKCQVNLTYW